MRVFNHQELILTGGFWQFTSDLAKKDSAYTNQRLRAHTDTTYFSDPAGLQTFHLLSHTRGEGGATLLVDGFRAADILRQESYSSFDVLTTRKIMAHASGNDGISITPTRHFPVLSRHEPNPNKPDWLTRKNDTVMQVRWNNDDRAALPPHDQQGALRFYSSARKWAEILQRQDSEYWVQLKPGRPLSKW